MAEDGAAERAARSGVLVRVSGPDPKGAKADARAFYAMEAGRTTLSASGLACRDALGRAVVLTSASLISPFLRLPEPPADHAESALSAGAAAPPDELMDDCFVDAFFENGRRFVCRLARIVRLDAARTAAELLIGGSLPAQRGIDACCVAILELVGAGSALQLPQPRAIAQPPHRGEQVLVASSPFGLVSPPVFQNSLTTGVVSNLVRPSRDATASAIGLVLIDARCLPGAEGGAVYNAAGELVGLVAPSLERGDKSAVELGTVLPVHLFVVAAGLDLGTSQTAPALMTAPASAALGEAWTGAALGGTSAGMALEGASAGAALGGAGAAPLAVRRLETPALVGPLHGIPDWHAALERCYDSVVLISINSSWGTGVLVSDAGHIITCAHLFRPWCAAQTGTKRLGLRHSFTSIHVSFRDRPGATHRGLPARLLFCSKGPIDIAVIQLDVVDPIEFFGRPIALAGQRPRAGRPCIAVGHAIFDPSMRLTSTVSAGVVAKVVTHPRDKAEPAILQTSASVFRGHSGGLLADEAGRLLGILTSNARHSDGSIIPTINFSIPLAMLTPLLEALDHDEETQGLVFDAYDRDDAELLALWRLEAGLDPPPELAVQKPALPADSRFAEFLSQMSKL